MPTEVLMPALSPTMTEGNLAKWHKKEGDAVKAGDLLAEIETDKATMDFEAVDEGTLGRILVPEGTQGVKVNQPIAVLLEEGEDAKSLGAIKPATAPAAAPAASPAPAAEPKKAEATPPAPAPVTPKTTPAPAPVSAPAANGHAPGERIFISPLARRLADEAGLDLAALAGSGPRGRIVKADVESAISGGTAKPRPAAAAAPSAPSAPRAPAGGTMAFPTYGKDQVLALAGNQAYTEVPISAMRRVIANRLTEAKQTIPHFYLTMDCEIDKLLAMRADINAATDSKVSVNDFVIKAAALALKKVPEVNASWSEDVILHWDSIDISVAVAIDAGLITPIVRNADQKGLGTISSEMKDLGARAKSGKLKLSEFQGGSFSISNLGMFGTSHFTAIINPPQSCILAVGAGEQRAVVKNGALAIATVMSCTIACDHRVVDGATGARYMQAFKKIIEAPATLAL